MANYYEIYTVEGGWSPALDYDQKGPIKSDNGGMKLSEYGGKIRRWKTVKAEHLGLSLDAMQEIYGNDRKDGDQAESSLADRMRAAGMSEADIAAAATR